MHVESKINFQIKHDDFNTNFNGLMLILHFFKSKSAMHYKGLVTHKRKLVDIDLRFIAKRNFVAWLIALRHIQQLTSNMTIVVDWNVFAERI